MTTLAQLRRDLVNAKIALRDAKDAHEIERAIAEQRAIDGGATGKNAEERARALTIALNYDRAYDAVLNSLRDCEAEVDRLSSEVLIYEDGIRENEARIRDKLADALLRKRVDDAVVDHILNASDEEALSW